MHHNHVLERSHWLQCGGMTQWKTEVNGRQRDGELYIPALGTERSGCYKKYLVDRMSQNWKLIGCGAKGNVSLQH